MKTLGEIAKQKWVAEKLRERGYSKEEIKKFRETIACPRCGQGFLSFPEGWGWLSHLSNCSKPKP
jgi:hypothetical protein